MTQTDESVHATDAKTWAIQAEECGEAIRALYREPQAVNRQARIAELHHRQGEAFKFGEIYSTLAVADELAEMRRLMVSGAVTL